MISKAKARNERQLREIGKNKGILTVNKNATGKKAIFNEKGKRTSIFFYSFELPKVEAFKKQLIKERQELRRATQEAKPFILD